MPSPTDTRKGSTEGAQYSTLWLLFVLFKRNRELLEMPKNNDIIYKYQPLWNKWYIESLIGKGNYGSVYKITRKDLSGNYVSAVKIISVPSEKQYREARASFGNDEAAIRSYFSGIMKKFADEIKVLCSLAGNTNIIDYQDHDIIEKKDKSGWDILIRMEYSTPLSKHVEGRQLSWEEAVRIGIDICSALELCSKKGIIHRDVKDENIFVNKDGVFKLGDFGIARQLSAGSKAGTFAGTPLYMAPEVYKEEKYNAAVDIYSLGIVLYKLLNNGRIPFLKPGQTNEGYITDALNKRMLGEKLPIPVNADDKLGQLILKACAYRAEDRYTSATEMKEALENVLVGKKARHGQKKEPQTIRDKTEFLEEASDSFRGVPYALRVEVSGSDTDAAAPGAKRKRKRPRKAVILWAALAAILLAGCFSFLKWGEKEQTYGNTGGNIVNGGYVAIQNEKIYYSDYLDGNSLYLMNKDETGKTKLNDDASSYINVAEDWIYYINGSDENKIYKMKTDGSGRAKLTDEYCSGLTVEGDWIYYISITDDGRIYRIKTDGTGRMRLNDKRSTNLTVNGSWVYFLSYEYYLSDNGTVNLTPGGISRVRTDGTREMLIEEGYGAFAIYDGYVYYANHYDGGKLYRKKIDGTGSMKLSDDIPVDINAEGDWIYYCNNSDESKLYKTKTDGSGRIKLSDNQCSRPNVTGEWIYYINKMDIDQTDSEAMYRINTDGTNETIVR